LIDEDYISYVNPISHNATLHDLFLYFKENPSNSFVPVVNESNHLTGIIYEDDIKQISYSQYGLALAKNSSNSSNLYKFLKSTLCIEESWGIDKTLEVYNMQEEHHKGIFVTKANKYLGFINVNSLLSLSHKRNIEIAANQNPLTKLPGNSQIEEFIYRSFKGVKDNNIYHMLYFDFNDFKPFNDIYGFRQGDRAILLFKEIIQKELPLNTFIGHVGGDDFFIGFKNESYENVYEYAYKIQTFFHENAKAIYNKEDLENGFISSFDRFNTKREFKLLSVSCAIIEISGNTKKENFNSTLGKIKKVSKSLEFPLGVCL